MINKEIIKQNFSRCAPYYDRYATVQSVCAAELIARVKANGYTQILELGCGTGNYTKLLREKFPQAAIRAIDISSAMVAQAKEKLPDQMIEFIVADGETANFKEQYKFDLISSNATLQWFTDLEQALAKYKELLRQDGVISFSTFGPFTFMELNKSVKELFAADVKITASAFFEQSGIERILRRLFFRKIKIGEKIYKERFTSLSALLRKIRYIGVRGNGASEKRFWSAKVIRQLEKIYKSRFKDIIATYQVFFCQGVK